MVGANLSLNSAHNNARHCTALGFTSVGRKSVSGPIRTPQLRSAERSSRHVAYFRQHLYTRDGAKPLDDTIGQPSGHPIERRATKRNQAFEGSPAARSPMSADVCAYVRAGRRTDNRSAVRIPQARRYQPLSRGGRWLRRPYDSTGLVDGKDSIRRIAQGIHTGIDCTSERLVGGRQ